MSSETELGKRKRTVPETSPDQVQVLIFHKNCSDGFGAACACYMRYAEDKKDHPLYLGLSHYDPFPKDKLEGKNVAIFDFSFKKKDMLELLDVCNALVLWDHHDTAEKEIGEMPNCHFDQEASGAILAWRYFFPDREVPLYLRYVDDADRWQWKLPSSREISAGAFVTLELKFEPWMEVLQDPKRIDDLIEAGRSYDRVIHKLGDGKAKYALEVYFMGFRARVVNCPFFYSKMGEMMLEQHPECQVAIVWDKDHLKGGLYNVHLRSRESDDVDVGEIAAKKGGGGHVHASAFKLSGDVRIEDLWA